MVWPVSRWIDGKPAAGKQLPGEAACEGALQYSSRIEERSGEVVQEASKRLLRSKKGELRTGSYSTERG